MGAVARSCRKLQEALAKASLDDLEILVEVVSESYLWRVLGERDRVATAFEYGTRHAVCQVSLRFGAES